MQVLSFNYTSINGKREMAMPKGKIDIKYKFDITEIAKEEVPLVKEDSVLRFNFSYDVNYEPKFASLEFKGAILVMMDPEKSKEILKDWKKKKIPSALRIALFNLIMSKCSIKALQLTEDLSLPPSMPLPKISISDKEGKTDKADTNYAG